MQRLLTIKDVAEILRCSVAKIYYMRKRGQIPAPITIGGANFWQEETLEKWVDDGCPAQEVNQ